MGKKGGGSRADMGEQGSTKVRATGNAAETHNSKIHEKPDCKKGTVAQTGDQGFPIVLGPDGETPIRIAACVIQQPNSKRQWFVKGGDNEAAYRLPPGAKKGKPAVTSKGKRNMDDVNCLILHEPITWTEGKAWTSLTAACLGVQYSLERDGTILYHAYIDDKCIHAKGYNNNSIAIEVINRFSTYLSGGQWIPPKEWQNIQEGAKGLQSIPYDGKGTKKWKEGQLRPPKTWTGRRKNWIMPPEKQMKSLYKLVTFIVKNSNIPIRFPGVLLSYRLKGGFYWGSFGHTKTGKILKSFGDLDPARRGGIMAHAHSGSDHTDGLFYEHYLMLRMLGNYDHKNAYVDTIAAANSVCTTRPAGKHKNKKNYTTSIPDNGDLLRALEILTEETLDTEGGMQSGDAGSVPI